MFGSSKPVVIDRYGSRRSRRVPRWLLLLLFGIAVGAGGVVFVQERYLPPRLSAAETAQLRQDFQQADRDRTQLKRDLAAVTQRLDTALADAKGGAAEAANSRQTVERLKASLAFVAEALPPDPRGGTVEVRAARISQAAARLDYDVLLYREQGGARPLAGVLQFVLAGESAKGGASTVTTKPVAVTVGHHEGIGGSVGLPDGFRARQATVQVLDRPDGKLLGMRVIYVK
jgi:hypothetical protein